MPEIRAVKDRLRAKAAVTLAASRRMARCRWTTIAVRAIRPVVMGRSNWLFAGSVAAVSVQPES